MNSIYLFTTIISSLVALLLWVIPSGEQCPKCKRYFTDHLKLKAIRKSDNAKVILEFDVCYVCKDKFNITETLTSNKDV